MTWSILAGGFINKKTVGVLMTNYDLPARTEFVSVPEIVSEKYKRIYDHLIQKRRDSPLRKKDGAYESHHVVPKCLGGSDDKGNIIVLTAREHYVAHLLLHKMYQGTDVHGKLLSAIIYMIGSRERFTTRKLLKFSSRMYEKLREKYAESKRGWYSRMSDEQKARLSKAISDKLTGRPLSMEHRRKIGLGTRGKKMPLSQRQKTSARMKLAVSGRRRKVRCCETGVIYDSILDAEKANPKCPLISKCCRGKVASSGGLHFEFADEDLARQFKKRELKSKDEYRYPAKKPVYCVELNREFSSLKSCADELKRLGYQNFKSNPIAPYTIRNVANGLFKSCGGLHFKWVQVQRKGEET